MREDNRGVESAPSPEDIARWLEDASKEDLKKVSAVSLLRAAKSAAPARLTREVDDILRRCAGDEAAAE